MVILHYDKALAAYATTRTRKTLAQHAYSVACIAEREAKHNLEIAKMFQKTMDSKKCLKSKKI